MSKIKKFTIIKFKSKPILLVKNVTKSFNNRVVLNQINFHLNRGEIFGILGPNGAGKSTLIRTLNRLQPLSAGNVVVDGIELNDETTLADLKSIRAEVGFVFQQFNLFPHLTVLENVTEVLL